MIANLDANFGYSLIRVHGHNPDSLMTIFLVIGLIGIYKYNSKKNKHSKEF